MMDFVERIKLPGASLEVKRNGFGYTWLVSVNHTIIKEGHSLTLKGARRKAENYAMAHLEKRRNGTHR